MRRTQDSGDRIPRSIAEAAAEGRVDIEVAVQAMEALPTRGRLHVTPELLPSGRDASRHVGDNRALVDEPPQCGCAA